MATQDIKFPQVSVKLTGTSGNAMVILGRVIRAMRKAGIAPEAIEAFTTEATSGDFDHLLQTVIKTVKAS